MSLSSAAAQAERFRSRSPFAHAVLQGAPLILSFCILGGTVLLYVGFFRGNLHHWPGNFEWTSLIDSSLPLVFAAFGQAVVVITRGLDLSVGGMIDLTNSLAALYVASNATTGTGSAGHMIAWSVIVLLVGAGGGLVNGVLVAYGRLQPILVTLATLSIFQGLAIKVLPEPGGVVPPAFTNILANVLSPWSLLWILFVVAVWFVFRRTSFGVGVFAVGNDENAARANGLPVARIKVGAYVMSGVFAAIAGLFFAATTTSGDATAGNSFVLTSIAAVVLGGISFFGGRGSAVGAVAGALTINLVVKVLASANINQLYEEMFEGLYLVFAVLLASGVGFLLRRRA